MREDTKDNPHMDDSNMDMIEASAKHLMDLNDNEMQEELRHLEFVGYLNKMGMAAQYDKGTV